MQQSGLPYSSLHIAIIMDGNGRWAARRGLSRSEGHRAGVAAVRSVVGAAPDYGIGTLTLFAFASSNWQRPRAETGILMDLFRDYLAAELDEFVRCEVRVQVLGRRDRLSAALSETIATAESATRLGRALRLRLAIDYSAREAFWKAAQRFRDSGGETQQDLERALAKVTHARRPAPAVDLLIRTGGEQRLSDCLLWEGVYAELYFSDKLWPDFRPNDLAASLSEFRNRNRRYGRIDERIAS